MRLDHIAIAAERLPDGIAAIEAALNVPLEPGGRHAHFGTENALLSLGDVYLEVIAPEPGPPPGPPRWFGLDAFAGPPRLANWICAVPDLDEALKAAPPDTGQPVALQRGDLTWRMAVPKDGSLPFGGGFPSLMEWGPGAHPIQRLPDRGFRLIALTILHPRAAWLAARTGLSDPRVTYRTGDLHLSATIDTPSGPVTL